MRKSYWALALAPALLTSCYRTQMASTRVAFNPNSSPLSIRRVAVPYPQTKKDDPSSVERLLVPAFSTEFGLLSLGYEVVDRGDMETLLEEHHLSLSALTDPKESAKVGSILGVQGLVIPSSAPGDDPNVKLVDVGSGRIVWNATGPRIFDKLDQELKKKGWGGNPDYPHYSGEIPFYRIAFVPGDRGEPRIRRVGVPPFYTGYGFRHRFTSSEADTTLVRLDGSLQADKISGDLLAAGFDVIERTHLSRVIEELRLGLTGALSEKNARRLKKLLGIDALVVGVAWNDVANPMMSVKFVHLETGKVLWIYHGKRSGFANAARLAKSALSPAK